MWFLKLREWIIIWIIWLASLGILLYVLWEQKEHEKWVVFVQKVVDTYWISNKANPNSKEVQRKTIAEPLNEWLTWYAHLWRPIEIDTIFLLNHNGVVVQEEWELEKDLNYFEQRLIDWDDYEKLSMFFIPRVKSHNLRKDWAWKLIKLWHKSVETIWRKWDLKVLVNALEPDKADANLLKLNMATKWFMGEWYFGLWVFKGQSAAKRFAKRYFPELWFTVRLDNNNNYAVFFETAAVNTWNVAVNDVRCWTKNEELSNQVNQKNWEVSELLNEVNLKIQEIEDNKIQCENDKTTIRKQKDAIIKARDKTIKDKIEEIKQNKIQCETEKTQITEEKDAIITEKNKTITEKEKEITKLDTKNKEYQEEIKELKKEIKEQESELEEMISGNTWNILLDNSWNIVTYNHIWTDKTFINKSKSTPFAFEVNWEYFFGSWLDYQCSNNCNSDSAYNAPKKRTGTKYYLLKVNPQGKVSSHSIAVDWLSDYGFTDKETREVYKTTNGIKILVYWTYDKKTNIQAYDSSTWYYYKKRKMLYYSVITISKTWFQFDNHNHYWTTEIDLGINEDVDTNAALQQKIQQVKTQHNLTTTLWKLPKYSKTWVAYELEHRFIWANSTNNVVHLWKMIMPK